MPLFDEYLIVDWSANGSPKKGKDFIWIAHADQNGLKGINNIATRVEAVKFIETIFESTLLSCKRLFAGFDFAFGYPKGAAQVIGGNGDWESVWEELDGLLIDDDKNCNNGFLLAGELNRKFKQVLNSAPFWGHPQQHSGRYPDLNPTKDKTAFENINEFRLVEKQAKGAKSTWQLCYNGAVGKQTMLGIAWLNRLRKSCSVPGQVAIWPFQTKFAENLTAQITIAEIYPSIITPEFMPGEVLDAAQVRTMADLFSNLDKRDEFEALLCAPIAPDADILALLTEEGWIVGANQLGSNFQFSGMSETTSAQPLDYIRDPAEIYRQSFETVEREADLSAFSPSMKKVATRLIHSCGMVDILDDLAFSQGAAEAGIAALINGAAVYCDVEMVKAGIIERNLPSPSRLVCTLNDRRAGHHGKESNNTRSAAGVDFWDDLAGSICVIGNAPTALFRLLERIDEGAAKPALIIGIPVGFIGAAESKLELAVNPRGCEFITVHGRRGGSAMASSVVNALAFLAKENLGEKS